MADEPRFLAAGGRGADELGYTKTAALGMKGEPEALSESDQTELLETMRRRDLEDRIRRREATAAEIKREIEHVDARGRYLRRQLRRLQRPV